MGADNPTGSASELTPQRVAELAGELSEAEEESRRKRLARQIASLGRRRGQAPARREARPGRAGARPGLRHRTGTVARGVRAGGQWLAGQVLEMAPKVPIRSNARIREQYPGLQTDQLADRLIASAARASAGVGAAVGVAAAVPLAPTAPVELAVETLSLVAIELKLIAELHEVYGRPAPGSMPQRMLAYTGAWADRRGVRITANGLALAVGSPLRRKLERRLLARASTSALALAPLLAGAVVGALIDHRETRKLGNLVRDDLRKRAGSHVALAES